MGLTIHNRTRSLNRKLHRLHSIAPGKREKEYSIRIKQLRKVILQKYNKRSLEQKQEFGRQAIELKAAQKRRIEAIAKKYRNEKIMWQRRLKEDALKNKKNFEQEFGRLKRSYQLQLENIRDIYNNQYLLFQKELGNSFNSQIEMIKKEYVNRSSNNQHQLEKLQKWMQDELINNLIERKDQLESSELEKVKLSAELKANNLSEKLKTRNSELEFLRQHIKQLEERVVNHYSKSLWSQMRPHGQNAPQKEGQENERPELQDMLSIIKDVAKVKGEMDRISGV